jgi:hypothetical protein
LSLPAEDLGGQGEVRVEGWDLLLRMNNLVLKAETVSRTLEQFASQGYYVTGVLEGADFGVPFDLALRWEEALQGFADGVHEPNVWYQATTAGLTWHVNAAWQVQVNYISLLLDKQQHAFPNSDLWIMQVQWNF